LENNSKFKIKNSTLPKFKKILVTGTAGFIGFHLCAKLLVFQMGTITTIVNPSNSMDLTKKSK
jgi:nucleoside-diphosphate-sugar epimerase